MWIISAPGWLFNKKSIMMHGNIIVNILWKSQFPLLYSGSVCLSLTD